jgi:hypothetical protein
VPALPLEDFHRVTGKGLLSTPTVGEAPTHWGEEMDRKQKRTAAVGQRLMDARFAVGFTRHLKTKKLIRRLGHEGFFYLVDLVLYARLNRPDGDLAGMSSEDIELAVEWHGEPGALVRGLIEVGYMDGDEGAYRLHDWADHQPWAVDAESRRGAARLAGLISQHGETEGRRMFHMDQTRRSESTAARSDNANGSLNLGDEALTSRSTHCTALHSTAGHSTAEPFVLPDWVPKEPWQGFEAMRQRIKKPLSDRAKRMAVNKLDDLRKQGHDAAKVLEQSEFNQWQDLYAPKDNGSRGQGGNGVDLSAKAQQAWTIVRAANQGGKCPAAWDDPIIGKALEAIGGWGVVRDMRTDDAPFRQRDFVTAYIAAARH